MHVVAEFSWGVVILVHLMEEIAGFGKSVVASREQTGFIRTHGDPPNLF